MSIQLIGIVLLALGALCVPLGYRMVTTVFVLTTILGASAALFIGSANIQPAHLFLGFLFVAVLINSGLRQTVLSSLSAPGPGFWLACLVAYGVLTAYMFPRLLGGSTLIIPLGLTEYGADAVMVPLVPTSSNLTQSVYLIGDLVCFALVTAIASAPAGFKTLTYGLLGLVAFNLMFAVVDVVTYEAGAQHLLKWLRNAQYVMHEEENVNGLKRIVGSFAEASAFAAMTCGLAAFSTTLFLCGYRPWLTGALGLCSISALVLSTSSAGMVGALALVLILYATSLRIVLSSKGRMGLLPVVLAPMLVFVVGLGVVLNEQAFGALREYFDAVVLNKMNTSSGVTRSSWNEAAMQNFYDTWGLGVGLGTVRTSNFVIALLSNVGIVGTALFAMFLGSVLFRRLGAPRSFPSDVRFAARNGCLGILSCGLLIAPTIDPGLLFCVFAGLAAAQPERALRPALEPVGLAGQPA